MTTSSGDAGVYTPEPVVRDHLAVHGAGGAEAANRMGAAVEHADRVGSADDVSGEPVERAFGGDSGTAEPGSEALHEPTGVEEVDLPWLTAPEDEDALDTAPGEPAESPASQRGSVETPAQEEPASAVPILGETARKEAAEEPEARVGEGGKGVDPSEGGEDVLPEDPALLVAARLERIAHSLRTRGPSGPMVEQQDDPLAVLVTGYLLGLTESKGR